MAPLRELPLLAAAGFASMFSMRMCDAMLPELARSFATRPAETAHVISAFAIAYGLSQLAYGPLGDRFGRPRVVTVATFACGLAALAAAMSSTLDMLAFSRVAMGIGAAGIIPLTMAWIGDQVAYAQRQEVLARLLGSTVLGMMAGAWLGGVFAETLGWRSAFLGISTMSFVLGSALWMRLPRQEALGAVQPLRAYVRQVTAVFGSAWPREVLAVSFLEGAFVFGALAFVPVYLHASFRIPLAAAGGILALFGLGGLIYSRFARRMLRRLGAPRLAMTGGAFLAAAFGVMASMTHWSLSVPACLVAGLGFYMLHNTLQTCATQLSTSARGTAVSVFVCALFLGQSSGIAGAAWLSSIYSPAVFFAIAGPALLASSAYFGIRLRAEHALRPS